MTETSAGEAGGQAILLRQRPIPDQLDYFSEQLAALVDPDRLDRDALIAVGATLVGLGAIASKLRAEPMPRITDGITGDEAYASAEFDLTIDEIRSFKSRAEAAEAQLKAVMQYTHEIGEVQAGLPSPEAAVARAGYWQALQRVSAQGAREQSERADAAEKELAGLRERIGEEREEWGQKYSGGGYLTKVDADWFNQRWPLADWIASNTRFGAVVGRRRIIVVEDWQDFREGEWKAAGPGRTDENLLEEG